MSSIETEHAGRRIVYAENEDVWRCWDMELEAKSLSALKTKINQEEAKARRIDNVVAIHLTYNDAPHYVAISMIVDDTHVWATGKFDMGNRRKKVSLDSLVPDTPENRKAIEEWQAQLRAINAAHKKAAAAKDAIPRLTLAHLGKTPKDTGEGQ